MDVANVVRILSYTMLMVTCLKCCVLSGLDFKAIGGTVNMT